MRVGGWVGGCFDGNKLTLRRRCVCVSMCVLLLLSVVVVHLLRLRLAGCCVCAHVDWLPRVGLADHVASPVPCDVTTGPAHHGGRSHHRRLRRRT